MAGAAGAGTTATTGAGGRGVAGTTGVGSDTGVAGTTGGGGDTGVAGTTGAAGDTGGAGANAPPGGATGLPAAGNPAGKCAVPADGKAEDTSKPDHVIGTGTAASCTSDAVVSTIAKGGVITFDCGPDPVTITLTATAKIVNNTGPKIVIDGGGKVTLSGGGKVRILYQDTCDQAQTFTTSHCDDQTDPQLTVQNLTFVDGNATGQTFDGGGGGAIFVRGGRLKIVDCRFFGNTCEQSGPDIGGGAVRALSQSMGLPVYVVGSTFGGRADLGNSASNGGGLSSIGVSYTVLNSLFSYNKATGGKSGPSDGGCGGGIYNDGNTYTLTLCGVDMEDNNAIQGGGAIFFVSNDHSGSLFIQSSTLSNNPNAGFDTQGFPGVFAQAKQPPQVTDSTIK